MALSTMNEAAVDDGGGDAAENGMLAFRRDLSPSSNVWRSSANEIRLDPFLEDT